LFLEAGHWFFKVGLRLLPVKQSAFVYFIDSDG